MRGCGIIIVGAGFSGLVAAFSLKRFGVPFTVFERAPELGEVGAGISLSPNATRVLIALGLRSELDQICNSPEALCSKHWETGEILNLDDSVDYDSKYGAPYYQVHRADLHDLLVRTVTKDDSDAIRLDKDCVRYDTDEAAVTAHFADGTSVEGEVLIGCDGIKSVLRDLLWNPGKPHYLGYLAYRGLTPVDCLPNDLIVPSSATFSGPGHHFTRYLVRGKQLVNYVGFAQREEWVDEGWNVEASIDEVLDSFAGWAPEIQHIIKNTQQGRCHKWGLLGRDPLKQWTKGRVTLLGDAAHPMLPFLGQGSSMAIEDGYILGRAIGESDDAQTGLSRYEEERRPRANAVVEASAAQADRKHRAPKPGGTIAKSLQPEIFTYDATTVPL